jgi:hypothetical protein
MSAEPMHAAMNLGVGLTGENHLGDPRVNSIQ